MTSPVIDTPIADLYLAGKLYIPQAAETLSEVALYMRFPIDHLDVGAAAAGDPQIMRDLLFVLSQVSDAVIAGTTSLNHAAIALVKTADDFVATDAEAAADADALRKALNDPTSDLGLNDEHRDALLAKKPESQTVWGKTGDRSVPGGDEAYYDDNGRKFHRHQDSTPAPTETPDEDRDDRDSQQESDIDDITEDL